MITTAGTKTMDHDCALFRCDEKFGGGHRLISLLFVRPDTLRVWAVDALLEACRAAGVDLDEALDALRGGTA